MIDFYKIFSDSENKPIELAKGLEDFQEKLESLNNDDVLFDDWLVKLNGDMVNIKHHDYTINESRLQEKEWISHIKQKDWNMNSFIDAYWFALKTRKGISKIDIKIY
jgi:hypothetical protein